MEDHTLAYHQRSPGSKDDQEAGSQPGEDGHDTVDYGEGEERLAVSERLTVLQHGQGLEPREEQHEADTQHTHIEQPRARARAGSLSVRHTPTVLSLAVTPDMRAP